MNLEVVAVDRLRFSGGPARDGDYLLSPFVYDGGQQIMVRAVPHLDDQPERKISRVFHGRSADGLGFSLDEQPAVAAGPEPVDAGGVEDPTVVEAGDRRYVFYSGWNGATKRSTLLVANSSNGDAFVKRGAVLPAQSAPAKEAALAQRRDGWTMFFEVERDGASVNGTANAEALSGPWTLGDDVLAPRAGHFDDWHVSPIGFVRGPGAVRVLLYNGATRDGRWQIGWCTLDEECRRITSRISEPLIVASRAARNQRELAFGSSVIARDGQLWLYYSIGDAVSVRASMRWS